MVFNKKQNLCSIIKDTNCDIEKNVDLCYTWNIEKYVEGLYEKDKADPKQVTFVLKNESKINYEDYLQTSNDISQKNLQMSDHTCRVCSIARVKKLPTIIEFTSFQDTIMFHKRGRFGLEKVQNSEINVKVVLDMECGNI